MVLSLMPDNFICSFLINGFKANDSPATLPMIMRLFAKLILLIYGLSIAGYVLLDGVHEVLHQFKNNIHHHEHDHHHSHDHHHHVEDHHVVPTAAASEESPTVVIYYFHLFFQNVEKLTFPLTLHVTNKALVYDKVPTLTFPPPTPPPDFA